MRGMRGTGVSTADDDIGTGRSRLFTVRIWTEPAGQGVAQRGSVRDVGNGAFRNFREWSDLTSFITDQLEDGRSTQGEA